MSTRRSFIALALILFSSQLLLAQYKYTSPEKLRDGIRVGTLKDAGLDESKLVAGANEILSGNYANIHSLLVFKGDRLVFETYFSGEDFERGKGPIGMVKHTRDTLHDMRSVTKSVVSMAVLHAHANGKIKSLDTSVFDLFPEYAKYADGDKRKITVRHLLTMTAGFEWDEEIPYSDPKNSEIQMDRSQEPVEYVLSQKLATQPGSTFNYSGGSSQLLAEIVRKASGMSVDEYTAKYIFEPLGITLFKWVKMRTGQPSAASGLRLRSRDMAKLGIMLLANKGRWNGKQIIPRKLAEEAAMAHTTVATENRERIVKYGYQIWLFESPAIGLNTIDFRGNGGQTVRHDPATGITMVATAGHYNARGIKKNASTIYPDFIHPAIIQRKAAK